jgi:hypothetical protein
MSPLRNADLPTIRIINIFVASPGDVREERDLVEDIVRRINRNPLIERNFIVHVKRWENVQSQLGESAQWLIDEYLEKESLHVFIGIMWHRIGTPYTKNGVTYRSGTHYELVEALRFYEKRGWPIVLFYHRNDDYPDDTQLVFDTAQSDQVKEFVTELKSNDIGLVGDYHDSIAFQEKFERDIWNIISQLIEQGIVARQQTIYGVDTLSPSRSSADQINERVEIQSTLLPLHLDIPAASASDSTSNEFSQPKPSFAPFSAIYFQQSDGLMSFDEWENSFKSSVTLFPFELDDKRQKFIDNLDIQATANLIKILYGVTGVGKTRLALEAIRASDAASHTLYATSPSALPKDFFRQLPADSEPLLLVIDQCDSTAIDTMRQKLSLRDLPISVIAISSDPLFINEIRNPAVFFLPSLEQQALSRFWQNISGNMSDELRWKLELEIGGNLKLAVAAARAINSGEIFTGLYQLTQTQVIRHLLESCIDQEERQVLQALSLLDSIKLHSDESSDAKAITQLLDISFPRLLLIAERLRRKGLVRKDRYHHHILNGLLAIYLAEEAWQALEPKTIVQALVIEDGMLDDLAKARLLQQLANIGHADLANKAANLVLLHRFSDLDLSHLKKQTSAVLLSSVAEASPDIMIPRLAALIWSRLQIVAAFYCLC